MNSKMRIMYVDEAAWATVKEYLTVRLHDKRQTNMNNNFSCILCIPWLEMEVQYEDTI